MRALLGGMLVALALLLAGCGGDDGGGGGSGDALDEALSYLPADASGVVVVDTDLDGGPIKALERALGEEQLGAPTIKESVLGTESDEERDEFENLFSVLGDEVVIGAPELGALQLVSDELGDETYIAALHVDDTDALEKALPGFGLNPVQIEKQGVKYWQDEAGEITAALHDSNLVVGFKREHVDAAIATHDGPESGQFTPDRLDAATKDLGADAPIRVYVNAARLLTAPGASDYLDVPWVAALKTAAATITGDGDTIVVDAAVNTDPSAITDADLPLPTGSPALELTSSTDAINGASANQSQTTTFLLELLRTGRPTGRFATDVATVERERGIDFDEEVLRQFDGPSASTVMPGGAFAARSTVKDPARMEKTLELIAPDLGRLAQDLDPLRELGLTALLLFAPDAPVGPSVLEGSDIDVEKIDGERALYRMSNLNRPDVDGPEGPDEIVLGLVGDVFVVADGVDSAKAIATAELKPVQGLTGASVAYATLTGELREAVGGLFLDVGDRDLRTSATASRERLRASVRLAPLKP